MLMLPLPSGPDCWKSGLAGGQWCVLVGVINHGVNSAVRACHVEIHEGIRGSIFGFSM